MLSFAQNWDFQLLSLDENGTQYYINSYNCSNIYLLKCTIFILKIDFS